MIRLVSYTSRWRWIALSLFSGLLGVGLGWSALGQFRLVTERPEDRAKRYDELAADVGHLEQQGLILKKAVQLVRPTVVHIEADKSETSGRVRRDVEEAGSGTIIELNSKFYVLTNRHVIRSAAVKSIRVKLSDGRVINPTAVWSDPGTDIAVMAIPGPELLPARLGDSDKVDIGDFVLAVGSPFGLSQSVTFGIISAKGRRELDLGEGVEYQDFLQTDAAINPGNSGGPLINLRGEVIGMNTAIASQSGGNEGIGFSIPINIVMVIARQLVERGAVARAYLGVKLDGSFNPTVASQLGLSRPTGARVVGIVANSPADRAKIQIDDVILEINGVPIDDDTHLVSVVALTEVGKELPLVILRDRKPLRLTVKVGNRGAFEPAKPPRE